MDEPFLVLVAVLVCLLVLQVYFGLLVAQHRLAAVTLEYYLSTHNLSLLEQYLYNYSFVAETTGAAHYSFSCEQLFPLLAVNQARAEIIIYYSSPALLNASMLPLRLLRSWFRGLRISLHAVKCENVVSCVQLSRPAPYQLVVGLANTSFTLLGRRKYLFNPRSCPQCMLAAFALAFGGYICENSVCVSSVLLGNKGGYICPQNVRAIEDYFVSGAPIVYAGPAPGAENLLEQLKQHLPVVIPGSTVCVFAAGNKTVVCDFQHCLRYSGPLPPTKVPAPTTERLLCASKYGECKMVGCWLAGKWYRL
ncbi:MAG: hypothetical protein GXO42_01595 [bacterium]|nr:hypothetical protein [bacterium]